MLLCCREFPNEIEPVMPSTWLLISVGSQIVPARCHKYEFGQYYIIIIGQHKLLGIVNQYATKMFMIILDQIQR